MCGGRAPWLTMIYCFGGFAHGLRRGAAALSLETHQMLPASNGAAVCPGPGPQACCPCGGWQHKTSVQVPSHARSRPLIEDSNCVCGRFITNRTARASKDHHCIFGLQTSSHSPGPRCVTRQQPGASDGRTNQRERGNRHATQKHESTSTQHRNIEVR